MLDWAGPSTHTYEVIGVNIATTEVFEPHDIIHAVVCPAAAASINRLVVCGGVRMGVCTKYCQLYSTQDDRYARPLINDYSLLPSSVFCGFHSVGVHHTSSPFSHWAE